MRQLRKKIKTNNKDIKNAVKKHISDNHALQHYFHLDAVDYPVGTLSPELHSINNLALLLANLTCDL